MRRHWLATLVAALLMIIVAPASGRSSTDRDVIVEQAAVAIQSVAVTATAVRDEAAMVVVGTAMIALAAALRRAA